MKLVFSLFNLIVARLVVFSCSMSDPSFSNFELITRGCFVINSANWSSFSIVHITSCGNYEVFRPILILQPNKASYGDF